MLNGPALEQHKRPLGRLLDPIEDHRAVDRADHPNGGIFLPRMGCCVPYDVFDDPVWRKWALTGGRPCQRGYGKIGFIEKSYVNTISNLGPRSGGKGFIDRKISIMQPAAKLRIPNQWEKTIIRLAHPLNEGRFAPIGYAVFGEPELMKNFGRGQPRRSERCDVNFRLRRHAFVTRVKDILFRLPLSRACSRSASRSGYRAQSCAIPA